MVANLLTNAELKKKKEEKVQCITDSNAWGQ